MADKQLYEVLDADGSLATDPASPAEDEEYTLKVGVLATDAQHGVRGGGTQHAAVTDLANGFMTSAQKAALEQAATDITALDGRVDDVEADIAALPAPKVAYVGGTLISGSGQQTIEVTGLLGNSVDCYIVEYYLVNGAGGAVAYEIYPNGTDPGNAARTQGDSGGAGFTVDDELHINNSTNDIVQGTMEVYPKSGKSRLFLLRHVAHANTANLSGLTYINAGGVWTNTATQLTSIRIHSSHATGVGVGSYIRIWSRTQ